MQLRITVNTDAMDDFDEATVTLSANILNLDLLIKHLEKNVAVGESLLLLENVLDGLKSSNCKIKAFYDSFTAIQYCSNCPKDCEHERGIVITGKQQGTNTAADAAGEAVFNGSGDPAAIAAGEPSQSDLSAS